MKFLNKFTDVLAEWIDMSEQQRATAILAISETLPVTTVNDFCKALAPPATPTGKAGRPKGHNKTTDFRYFSIWRDFMELTEGSGGVCYDEAIAILKEQYSTQDKTVGSDLIKKAIREMRKFAISEEEWLRSPPLRKKYPDLFMSEVEWQKKYPKKSE